MADPAAIDPAEDALYERVRLLLFSADLPVQRLADDIEDIGRFTAPTCLRRTCVSLRRCHLSRPPPRRLCAQ